MQALPPSLGDLAALRTLSLQGNLLKSLPKGLRRLAGLRALHLQDNEAPPRNPSRRRGSGPASEGTPRKTLRKKTRESLKATFFVSGPYLLLRRSRSSRRTRASWGRCVGRLAGSHAACARCTLS